MSKLLGALVLVGSVVVGAVVAKQNETAGGAVFIVGVVVALMVAFK